MKKRSTLITLLLALLASLGGNVYQYTAAIAYQHEQPSEEPSSDDTRPHLPGDTHPDALLREWHVRATFAITYEVKPTSAAFQDGYQVTTYHTDRTPSTLKSKKQPGPNDVFWSPIPEGLPGVISVKVHSVEVIRGKTGIE